MSDIIWGQKGWSHKLTIENSWPPLLL